MALRLKTFEEYLTAHHDRFLAEFGEFIGQPSVAADGRGIAQMADLVAQRLRALGADVTLFATGGAPIVFAEMGPADAARTLMIYNHYDVQPEDPMGLWESDPFTLTQREGKLFGRGTSDDKGELLSRIQALEAWLKTQGELPVRIKWVVEGEEEIGSVHLEAWVREHAAMLAADGILWEGGGYDEARRPLFGLGGKGLAYFELRCRGADHDLHSSIAPMIVNPAWRLVWALATLKDADDNITLDGYMEHVTPLSADDLARIDAVPMEFAAIRRRCGIEGWLRDMSDEDARRRYIGEPTITICGIQSGYVGEGSKTVLPAEAFVKLDFRLVRGLTPELAHRLLRKHLDRRGFEDITIKQLGAEEFAASRPGSLAERAARAASRATWDQEPIMMPWYAGSGPIYPLSTLLDIPVVFAGATWHPDARAHSPNENIFVEDYVASMRFTAAFLDAFATLDA